MPDETKDHPGNDLANRIRSLQDSVARGRRPDIPDIMSGKGSGKGIGRIGADFVSFILASVLIGWLVDHEFGSAPWALLVMVFLGFIAAIVNVGRALRVGEGSGNETERKDGQG